MAKFKIQGKRSNVWEILHHLDDAHYEAKLDWDLKESCTKEGQCVAEIITPEPDMRRVAHEFAKIRKIPVEVSEVEW